MKRPLLFLLATPFVAGIAVAACGSSDDCNETKTCPGASSSGSLDGGDGAADGPVIVPPKDCDLTKEPKDSPACVDDMVGVFVDAQSGVDSGPGTKTSPVKTIKAALEKAGQKRIYVCEGTYKEHVKLTGPNSMYGGFACMKWDYTGTKAKIAPEDKGYALHAEKLSSAIVISDLDFSVVDATEPGESSIGMFFSESMKVSLKRVDVKAGKGKDGADGAQPASNLFSETVGDLQGTPNTAATGGSAKTCACKTYGTTGGGKGGNAGNPAETGGPGVATPQPTPMGPSRTGAGGMGFNAGNGCMSGVSGSNGKPRAKGKAALESGVLDSKGWGPTAGGDGETGDPGAGGGGGGGGGVNGSGGGGCGGCGGSGGLGGKGGGASIAVLSLTTALALDSVKLTTADAGKGGTGGKASAGGPGGEGGTGTCAGGFGGNGAGGGGGAGGSGGLSAGIVRKGGAVEGTPTVVLGAKGAAGLPGEPGAGGTNILDTAEAGAQGDVGRDGISKEIVEVQ